MDIKRREFLKLAGLSTIAGIAAPAAARGLLTGEVVSGAQASGGNGHAAATTNKTRVRYGMVIDHRVFAANSGLADKCIAACHQVHNVPDFRNKKDEIKWIWKAPFEKIFPSKSHQAISKKATDEEFLVLCNHCENPPCVRVCPTQATFKNKDNGIVMMDFHRCIGCRFCMAACPYGSRSFNWRDPRGIDANGRPFLKERNPDYPTRMRGVVEKCNFCAERLARGLQPACVDAAKGTGGIVFGDLHDATSEIRKVLEENFTIQRKAELGTNPSVFYIV